jgi:lipopolysaccharide export system protein LptC
MSMAGEPAREPVVSRPRYDWSARARTTAFDARRYSRFVTRMKRLLSLAAFAVIFAVLAFFFVERGPRQLQLSYEKLGSIDNDLAMINPRLTGADARGNPFTVTARQAVQDARNSKRATLVGVEADMSNDKGWVNARAGRGSVDMAAHRLELAGGIDIYTDNGYTMHADSASADLASNVLTGEHGMSGQGPLGAMRADKFRYERQADRLVLSGHVHITTTGVRP